MENVKEMKIRIVNKYGVKILKPFRFYKDAVVIGHANYDETFEAEVLWLDSTSRYYQIKYNGESAWIFSDGVREKL